MKKIKFLFLCSFLLSFCMLFGNKTSIPNLYYSKMENGLDVFVYEDASAPLAYIEIAVKGGARGQTKETAGLFHLYEHMMFKGNSLYKNSAAVQKAITDLGVTSWNGSTSSEYINYYFTVPSTMLEQGLQFWSVAIREPLLREDELESEKKVVISEIQGGYANPGSIIRAGYQSYLFSKSPWKLDPGGTVENVQNATVENLKEIKNKFYVPNNSALFIGGDVSHEDVFELVKKIYGSWEKVDDPWSASDYVENTLNEDIYLVFPQEEISTQFSPINIYFHGPCTINDEESTFAADIWTSLMENPSNQLAKNLFNNSALEILSQEYTSAAYITQRENGLIVFQTQIASPYKILPRRVQNLFEELFYDEIPNMVSNKKYFSKDEIKISKNRVKDDFIIDSQTPESFLTNLRFWWAATSPDYYFKYQKNLNKVSVKNISNFAMKYLLNKHAVVCVFVNPEVYELQKESFDAAGFIKIDSSNAYWFLNK